LQRDRPDLVLASIPVLLEEAQHPRRNVIVPKGSHTGAHPSPLTPPRMPLQHGGMDFSVDECSPLDRPKVTLATSTTSTSTSSSNSTRTRTPTWGCTAGPLKAPPPLFLTVPSSSPLHSSKPANQEQERSSPTTRLHLPPGSLGGTINPLPIHPSSSSSANQYSIWSSSLEDPLQIATPDFDPHDDIQLEIIKTFSLK
jgi:hypothetical protein